MLKGRYQAMTSLYIYVCIQTRMRTQGLHWAMTFITHDIYNTFITHHEVYDVYYLYMNIHLQDIMSNIALVWGGYD